MTERHLILARHLQSWELEHITKFQTYRVDAILDKKDKM